VKVRWPREIGFLTPLKDHEIINKYNQFMQGLGNYYIRQIAYPSRIGRWIYILYYSCIKTLATKHRLSTKEIINKYGYLDLSDPNVNERKPKATDQRIVAKLSKDNQTNYTVLLNYKELMYKLMTIRNKYIINRINGINEDFVPEADFLTLQKVNFRTAFKETSFCAVCESNEGTLHNHHIKHLKSKNPIYKGFKGFDKIVAALGRKQIPVCRTCHENIHKGKYDKMSLDEVYDIRLIAPEGLMTFKDEPKNPNSPGPTKKNPKIGYQINEMSKTYFNPGYNQYLTNEHNKKKQVRFESRKQRTANGHQSRT
jgi:hypothetical protein